MHAGRLLSVAFQAILRFSLLHFTIASGVYWTHCYHEHILEQYQSVWNGDLSLANSTFSPRMTFHTDRFPSHTGAGSDPITVTTPGAFVGFVEQSRAGWDKYTFTTYRWVGDGDRIAVRWILDAVIGANYASLPTTLKQGESLTYNGTDFLLLNEETGLIDEVNIAGDSITFFHNLGLKSVTV